MSSLQRSDERSPAPLGRLGSLLLPVALLLPACTAQHPMCNAEALTAAIFDAQGLTPGEHVEFTGRVMRRSIMDAQGRKEELVFQVAGEPRTLRWELPRKLSIDLQQGQEVEVLIRRTMGFGGSATGIRIFDNEGIVLLADDGAYGNALRPHEMEPFEVSQKDAGCRNRANRPGDLNNFFLRVEAGEARVQLMQGSQAELEVNNQLYSVLAVKSTARVDEVLWTDAPYSHEAFVIARRPRSAG